MPTSSCVPIYVEINGFNFAPKSQVLHIFYPELEVHKHKLILIFEIFIVVETMNSNCPEIKMTCRNLPGSPNLVKNEI